MNKELSLSQEQAYQIIAALRKGTPPEEGVDIYSVGREVLLSHFQKKLSEIRKFRVSDVKLVSGDFGHGKSHFLDLLKNLALKENFVVSKSVLHSKDLPFDQLMLVVQSIMGKISTPEGKINGLEYLLNTWSDQTQSKSEQEIYRILSEIGIYPDMRMKLVEYRRHFCSPGGPKYGECLQVLKWFEGKETKTKTFKDVREYISNFVLFVRYLGFSGFVVMLDEAEAITSLSRITRRDLANENIRQIIDNDQGTKGFYFILASTPTFLSGEDDRGAQSYQALWRRISDPLQGFVQNSPNKVIVDLPKLTEEEFFSVSKKIKSVFEVAIGKEIETVSDNHLRLLANYVQTRTDQRIGTMVRSTVAIFDAAILDGFDFKRKFEVLVEKSINQEAIDRAK